MMRHTALVTSILLLVLAPIWGQEDTRHLYVISDLLVADRLEAAATLVDWAESRGGYFTKKADEYIRLRVPEEATDNLREVLEEISEAVLRYDQSTVDLRDELQQTRSALEAREEILLKNLDYLDTSSLEGTLELEQEIRRLMGEIDTHRGRLQRMEHDRRMALLEVNLVFQQRTLPDGQHSNFPWIRSVDFHSLMSDSFMTPTPGMVGAGALALPEGFARISRRPEHRGISAEGVRFRIRSVDNYPEQSQEFWRKALSLKLAQRGYIRFPGDAELKWDHRDAFAPETWALPWGHENYIYITGIRVRGGKIDILEVAGPVEEVLGYME